MHLRSINSVLPGHSGEQSTDTTNSTYSELCSVCLGIPLGRRADCKKLRSVRSPTSEYDVGQSANASSHPSLSSCKPFLSGISGPSMSSPPRSSLGFVVLVNPASGGHYLSGISWLLRAEQAGGAAPPHPAPSRTSSLD